MEMKLMLLRRRGGRAEADLLGGPLEKGKPR